MTAAIIALAIVLAALAMWLALLNAQSHKKSDALERQLTELRGDLQAIGTAQAQSTGQIRWIGQNVAQRLESVTSALRDGVTNSGQIASQGQTAIANELKNTREQIGLIQKQIGEVQEQSRGLSQATRSASSRYSAARRPAESSANSRYGASSRIHCPHPKFALQYRFSSGEIADAVIFLRDEKLMTIDSKFPLEAFRRIAAEGDDARRVFASAVKGQAVDRQEIHRPRRGHPRYGADVCVLGERLLGVAEYRGRQGPAAR